MNERNTEDSWGNGSASGYNNDGHMAICVCSVLVHSIKCDSYSR